MTAGHEPPAHVAVLEGMTIGRPPARAGAPYNPQQRLCVLRGRESGAVCLDDEMLGQHTLFLGSIGSGKTNTMLQLVDSIRRSPRPGDVLIVFDTKGEFAREFRRDGDAVISASPGQDPSAAVWNLFLDLPRDPGSRGDEIQEIGATIFGDARSGENAFFGTAACAVFAAVTEIMMQEGGDLSNAALRQRLEQSADQLHQLISANEDVAATARYLEGERAPDDILAFLQQAVSAAFSGAFGRRDGRFSVRDFVRRRGGAALFIEYDVALGSRLLPVYRVLLDLAIKEALSEGRRSVQAGQDPGSVFFVLDEFALLPHLAHVSDGINFGRQLGLKFLVGTQNVSQVRHAYGAELAGSILSGFGTVFAFRLLDDASRALVRERFGANRKQLSIAAAVRSAGVQQVIFDGHVIEDWDLAGLPRGQCVACLADWKRPPDEPPRPPVPPFRFAFARYVDGSARLPVSAASARLAAAPPPPARPPPGGE
jgi:hypothetical protein